ncbi:MAG: transcription repressor NadR [Sedimentibacter sp.]
MTSEERRENIELVLKNNTDPISATALAKKFSVSRQIIVGDIALMRAAGLKISATPRGYVLNAEVEINENVYTIACCHDDTNMAAELYAVVDNGGTLLDVTVEHPIYGQIVGQLSISSRYDADLFLKKVENNQAQPLMRLTGGIHLHTIKCSDEETFSRIMKALQKKNIILEQK